MDAGPPCWGCGWAMGDDQMSLTEFLLARIAERQKLAYYMLVQARELLADGEVPHVNGAETLVAEYRAMRQIVGEHDPVDPCEGTCGAPCYTLRYLALPYAGHPDFRKEWRA